VRFDWLDKQLAGKDYLTGKTFSVADAYLFTVLRWTEPTRSTCPLAEPRRLPRAVAARPKVKEALKAEGPLKEEAPAR